VNLKAIVAANRRQLSTVCSSEGIKNQGRIANALSKKGPGYSPLRRDMATANLIEEKDEQTTHARTRSAADAYTVKSDDGMTVRPIPVSHARRLDVDAVLARSLAKVVTE
jgi:hypothetical protein